MQGLKVQPTIFQAVQSTGAQLVAHLTQEPEVPDSIRVWSHILISPSTDSRRAVVSYWQKYVH